MSCWPSPGRQVIEVEAAGDDVPLERRRVLDVRPSRRRMEGLFLDVIREAETAGDATTGAAVGGEVADFLATPDRVLDDLTRPGATRAVGPAEPAPEPEPRADDAVLEQVAPAPPPPPPAEPARPLPEQEADEDVLGELVGGRKDREE